MLEKSTSSAPYADMAMLCVDDETSILRAMQRVFKRKPYQVIIADSAEQALQLLQGKKVNVIISDMRMPNMDGPAFLQEAAQICPDSYRIVMSGYADFESTVDAINLGKINRFINKPWNNNELVTAVEEGLEKIKLTLENKRLQRLVSQQNIQLKAWNQELEEKINLRTKQIRAALQRNERNNQALEKMLFNFIAINPYLDGGFAKKVAELTGRIAEHMGLQEIEIKHIRLAGLLSEIGLLGLDPVLYKSPFNKLNHLQQDEFLRQGKITQQILSPAQHMNNISDIIVHQYDRPEQTSSAADKTKYPTMSSKILAVARDYWRYACGKVNVNKMDYRQVCTHLKKDQASKYDPAILDVLFSHPELVDRGYFETGLTARQVLPGMLLKLNLYTTNHLLILAEGHEFTESSIDKLIQYESNQNHPLSIVVDSAEHTSVFPVGGV
jgi:response regulator RpfG family c-di-GMP phosphodiesterase